MWPFDKLFKTAIRELPPVTRQWKSGMWVMVDNKRVGILTKIAEYCEVHHVSDATGETVDVVSVPMLSLRQAYHREIPACRCSLTAEQAKELGYGS